MADEALFGPDGTQPLPPDPVLPDPLGGLVTGFTFADLVADTPIIVPPVVPVVTPAPAVRRPAAGVKRPATRSAAAPPAPIPVAQGLPSRPRQVRQPQPATRPGLIPVAPGVRGRPVPNRPAPPARVGIQPRRRSGAGCSVFLFLVVLLLFGFIVLGIVFGHTAGGLGTGG